MFGGQSLSAFWASAYDHGFVQQHPHASRQDWGTAVPFCIHGDAARAFKNQKLLIISWSPSLVRGCSWDTRFLYCVLPWEVLIPNVTIRQLLSEFRNDINDLQRSTHCGPWRFAFFGSKGDLEWMQLAYDLRRYYRCNLLCSRCFASQSPKHPELLYTDLSDEAAWRHTFVQTCDFLRNSAQTGPLPPLCQIAGWSAQSLLWDSMHNIYLGVAQDILGSGLQLLCDLKYFEEAPTERQLKVAHASVRAFCQQRGLQCGIPLLDQHNTSHMTGNVWYPTVELSKAAHAKLLLFWLADEFFCASILGHEAYCELSRSLLHVCRPYSCMDKKTDGSF
jgi:hypothetical protein